MGLVADSAFITLVDVEAVSGESDLGNLDKGNATIANALIQATNVLILWLRDNGIDPAKIANVSDLKVPAALQAAYLRLAAQPGESYEARAAKLKTRFEEALSKFVFVSSDSTSPEQTLAAKGLPRTVNMDSTPFFGPSDNRNPHRIYPGGFATR